MKMQRNHGNAFTVGKEERVCSSRQHLYKKTPCNGAIPPAYVIRGSDLSWVRRESKARTRNVMKLLSHQTTAWISCYYLRCSNEESSWHWSNTESKRTTKLALTFLTSPRHSLSTPGHSGRISATRSSCDGQDFTTLKISTSSQQSLWLCYITWQREIKIRDLKQRGS